MTESQLAALCRGLERHQDAIEVTTRTGQRCCGIPERVRMDLRGERPLLEVVIRTSRCITATMAASDVLAVRVFSLIGED